MCVLCESRAGSHQRKVTPGAFSAWEGHTVQWRKQTLKQCRAAWGGGGGGVSDEDGEQRGASSGSITSVWTTPEASGEEGQVGARPAPAGTARRGGPGPRSLGRLAAPGFWGRQPPALPAQPGADRVSHRGRVVSPERLGASRLQATL